MSICKKTDNKLHFLWFEKVIIDGDGKLENTTRERWLRYNVLKGVIDAGPDISGVKRVKEILPYGGVFSGYFTRGGSNWMEVFDIKHAEAAVAISRTRAIDEFVKEFNRGNITLPANTVHRKEIAKHLQNIKRISHLDRTGEEVGVWMATNPETHWAFSMLYSFVASQMLDSDSQLIVLPSSGGLIGTARVGSRPNQSRRLATR
jgi:hypothetical protein